jgi:methylenetetrahydrofolate reductase (NADPH)
MRLIKDIYAAAGVARTPVISFEFSTARSPEAEKTLYEKTLPALAKLQPDFCSVTYGPGGSTQDKTLTMVAHMQQQLRLVTMSHLTCVSATRARVSEVLDQAYALGIRNILALRGDPPGGVGEFTKTEGGFEYARELVELLRAKGGFSVGVAGFPEGHMACKAGKQADWDHLKEKIDAGADFVLTQLFWDNRDFYEFHEYLTAKLHVTIPIVPGVMPMLSGKQVKHITKLCGARWPGDVLKKLEQFGDDDDAVTNFGIEYATRQCEDLLKHGAPGIHLYTMNKLKPAREILKGLKLRKAVE